MAAIRCTCPAPRSLFPRASTRRAPGLRLAATLASSCLLLAVTPSLAQQSVEVQTKVPVADFFRTPRLDRPALSPNGRYLAAVVATDGGRPQLAVFDLGDPGQSKVVVGSGNIDVNRIGWVNDERIVMDTVDPEPSAFRPHAPGLWGVNRDGSGFRELIKASLGYIPRGQPFTDWRLRSVLSDGSNNVLVEGAAFSGSREFMGIRLASLDTTTGKYRALDQGAPEYVTKWVVDRQGRPAAVTTWHQGQLQAYLKSPEGAGWEKWRDAAAIGGTYWDPYWVDFDGQLLALGRRGDELALYAVDAKTHEPEPEPMVSLKGYDFAGQLVYDAEARRLLGVHYETDGYGTAWLDPVMRAAQATVDAKLPGTVNRIDCRRCATSTRMLVTAASDRQPRVFYTYDRDTKALTPIAESRPWIKASAMGLRDMHRFAARDGLSIPVLVTHPPGEAGRTRPAVVLVHGGPWVRGTHWAWEPQAQFLASRGYVVIEPEFRGSEGFGFKLFRAGWKQWGLAMQDDVADAVQWAVKQGWVDPNRVCIAGASYGGYATLMGLVRDHELYQCGIEWAGVTDLNLMYSIFWSDTSDEAKGYRMPVLIGDPVVDARQFKETSPVEQASKVRRPLLMAYGTIDRRVPIEHGKEFRDAVSRTNKDVEWVVYTNEGHGWHMLETNVDFWTKVEKFLARHIGTDAK